MAETPQLAGSDLARLALQNARAAAKTSPTPGPGRAKPKRTIRRGDGRELATIAAAITGLGADLPLDDGVAGGSLLNQWTTLCPQYAGCVEPASYDPSSRRLDLRPSSPAYAAQLRLLGGQLAKQINDKVGRPVVRTIRVLPVGHVPTQQPTTPTVPASQPDGPVKTREVASPGYRAALEAALAHRPEHQPTDPYVLEAMQRQEAALRANRQPETEDREAHWAQVGTQHGPRPDSVEASIAAAIARKRREAAGLTQPRRAFDVA